MLEKRRWRKSHTPTPILFLASLGTSFLTDLIGKLEIFWTTFFDIFYDFFSIFSFFGSTFWRFWSSNWEIFGRFFRFFWHFWHFLKKMFFFFLTKKPRNFRKNVKIAYQIIFKFSVNYFMIYFFYAYKKHFIFWLFKWKFKGNFWSSFDIFSRKCVFFRPLYESFLESPFVSIFNGKINI